MNNIIKKAMEMDEFNNDLPDVEVGEEVKLGKIWDGNGDAPEESYSYQLTDMDWINYCFEVVEENENSLETLVLVTGVEFL